MRHKHHIIPRHMGGTDDPSNLIYLTPKEHALAHLRLYEEYGKREDLLAFKGLSGWIGKEEMIWEKLSLGGHISLRNHAIKGTLSEHQRNAGKAGVGECKAKGARVSNKNRAFRYVHENGTVYKGAPDAAKALGVPKHQIRRNPANFQLKCYKD